jgi:predicted ATPase
MATVLLLSRSISSALNLSKKTIYRT